MRRLAATARAAAVRITCVGAFALARKGYAAAAKVPMSRFDPDAMIDYSAMERTLDIVRARYAATAGGRRRAGC